MHWSVRNTARNLGVLLFALALLSSGGAAGLVLCFEADGRIAFEVAEASGSHPPSNIQLAATSALEASSIDPHHGPCLDVPILAKIGDDSSTSIGHLQIPSKSIAAPLTGLLSTAPRIERNNFLPVRIGFAAVTAPYLPRVTVLQV